MQCRKPLVCALAAVAGGLCLAAAAPRPNAALPPSPAQATNTQAGPAPAGDLPVHPNPLRLPTQPPVVVPGQGGGPATSATGAAPKAAATATQKTEPKTPAPVVSVASGEGQDKPKFDPVKVNGPIFDGWKNPKLVLLFTGREDGYLEPCGCAGLDRMKGGLSRRHTLLKQLRAAGWPLVTIDAGGLVKGYSRQAELKFQTTVLALWRVMAYDAIALGAAELKLSGTEVAGNVAGVEGKPTPFVSANVDLIDVDSKITQRIRVVEAGGLKVGITAVLGKTAQEGIHNPEVKLSDPEAAASKALEDLKKQTCDLLILVAHASLEESEGFAKKFPDFEIVVTSGGPAEPPFDKPRTVGRTRLIEVGEKGMYAVALGLFDNPADPNAGLQVRYQRVPLDSRFAPSADLKALMKTYQDQLRDTDLRIRPVPNPRKELQGAFVGSAKCKDCHEESYRVWKKSGHARAYETLVKADPPRNFDPECISCHVVGWHPTKYFPYDGGFVSKLKTPQLTDVGCEACHGPGEAHAKAEAGGDKTLQERLRKAMVLTKADAEKHYCFECHDLDNSPDFDFKSYWPKVEHKEKE